MKIFVFLQRWPFLRSFMVKPKHYKGEDLTGVLDSKCMSVRRSALVHKLLAALDERYEDMSEGVAQATHIACFQTWPAYGNKDDIKGKILNKSLKVQI